MSKSLAELRQTKASLPERTVDLCLSQALIGQIEALEAEKADRKVESKQGPRRQASKAVVTDDLDDKIEALVEEMREHTGKLLVRASDSGDWRRWVIEHPCRETDEPGGTLDKRVGYGLCNVDDLINDMGRWVVSWNTDEVSADDWQFIVSRAANGDLLELCRTVIQMHEGPGAVPKSRPTSSGAQETETA